MADMYKASGTENLRADAHIYRGSQTDSPSAKGKDAGGTDNLKADHQVKAAGAKDSPAGGAKNAWPAGVQTFNERGGR